MPGSVLTGERAERLSPQGVSVVIEGVQGDLTTVPEQAHDTLVVGRRGAGSERVLGMGSAGLPFHLRRPKWFQCLSIVAQKHPAVPVVSCRLQVHLAFDDHGGGVSAAGNFDTFHDVAATPRRR